MAFVVNPPLPEFTVAQASKWAITFAGGTFTGTSDIGPQSGTDGSPIAPTIPDEFTGLYSLDSEQEFGGTTNTKLFTGSGRGSKQNNINAQYVDRIIVAPNTQVNLTGQIAIHGYPGGDGDEDRGLGGLLGIVFVDKFGAQVSSQWVTRRFSTVAGDPAGSATISRKTWSSVSFTRTVPSNAFGFYITASTLGHNANSTSFLKIDSLTYTSPTADIAIAPDGEIATGQNFTLRLNNTTLNTADIASIEYIAVDSSSVATSLGTGSTPTAFALTTSIATADTYEVHGVVTITGGVTFQTDSIQVVIGTPPPPDTREYKASNAYTYLVAKDFVGLADQIPPTANIVGMETIIDYQIEILARVKDKEVAIPDSQYSHVFSMAPTITCETILLEGSASNYSVLGGSNDAQQTVAPSDFTLSESGESEGKRWVVLQGTIQQVIIGGEDQLFGLSFLPSSSFLDTSLGIRFYPNLASKPSIADSGDACYRIKIDKLRVRIYFDAGSVDYYFYENSTETIIKSQLVAAYADEGKFENGDASGFMQITPGMEVLSGDGPSIREGMTIHSGEPPTEQNQIAVVSGPITYNGLAPYWDVIDSRSRYEFITANFYGDLTYDSIYGVNGNDRAFAYNGDWFYKIHTQPDADKDRPRHVEYYHTHLALGYGEGRVDISVVGEPYNFSGLDGASSWAIGDSVTGLLNLSGTMLSVYGNKSISAISGTTVDNFAQQTLSPKIGAIEYTIADMGFPVYANAYGVYTLSQTEQYGDYLGSPMSQDISPYIRPRLIRKNTSDKEVVVAWPVRSKNQYKLAFADGDVITMTLNGGQTGYPTFSKQQYTVTEIVEGIPETDVGVPAAISSELDHGGEERIHIAFMQQTGDT